MDLFAINNLTNLTYQYGTATAIFNSRIKHTGLRDGKLAFVNLKRAGGRAIFRFKIGKRSGDVLEIYVVPCGGSVDVEITHMGEMVEARRRIESFGKIKMSNPKKGARYYIKVFASNREELKRTSGVEIYATTRSSTRIPLPAIPSKATVKEYVELRSCDSITIGWIASPGQKIGHYCVVIKEGRLKENEGFRFPNQCGLEKRLKKSADFAVKYCSDVAQEKR